MDNEYVDHNWCPDCGEPIGGCACEDYREAYDALYGDEERNQPAWEMYPLEIEEPAHEGFYMDIDGESVHMLANPDMTPETQAALEALVRATRKMMDNKALSDWDNLRVCEVCGDRECVAPATKCHTCRFQEMIDES